MGRVCQHALGARKARWRGAFDRNERDARGSSKRTGGLVRSGADGQLEVRITGNQGSGVLSSMVQANGLIVLPHDGGNEAAGGVLVLAIKR